MLWPLVKLDLRKVLPPYSLILVALVGSLLGTSKILDARNAFAIGLGLAQGAVLAWCIFRDPRNTGAFVFSRPYTRQRIFWNRWLLAMGLQVVTAVLVCAVLAVGVRTWIQGHHLRHYPMVAPFELIVLWPLSVASLISFHISMFMVVRGRVLSPGSGAGWKRYAVNIVCLMLLAVYMGGIQIAADTSSGHAFGLVHWAVAYALVVTVMATAASLDGYRNMDIRR
jgi:hypothetical protein